MAKEKGKLAREDWIIAARRVFVVSGIDDVKIDRLAKEMKVTRGSFYWHFKNLEDLQAAVLEDWQKQNLVEMDALRNKWRESGATIHDVGVAWSDEGSEFPTFSMAIRIWARKNQMVASAVRSIDHAWLKLLEEVFRPEGFNDDECHVRARILYYHRIGYWALPLNESQSELVRLGPSYFKALMGRETRRDMSTWMEEHGQPED